MALTMAIRRRVGAETLDGLAATDPEAIRSRLDLQRIHRLMGTRRIVARALARRLRLHGSQERKPLCLLELGAGDGSVMLGVARSLKHLQLPVHLTLLDRQNLVSRETTAAFADAGWQASVRISDVFEWAAGEQQHARDTEIAPPWDVIVCNLFLHHFETDTLHSLLATIASCTRAFLACEPYRGWLSLAASHMVGVIGANAVTREDAVLSVHAGFRDTELSRLWPGRPPQWLCKEYSAGLFSHCLCCERLAPAPHL